MFHLSPHPFRLGLFLVIGLMAFTLTGVAKQQPAPDMDKQNPVKEADGSWSYVYTLSPNSYKLYPDESWLPWPYSEHYPSLTDTIKKFTRQSLSRAGLSKITVKSVTISYGKPLIVLSGLNLSDIVDFATMHQAFFDDDHALQGLNGVNLCQQTQGCWDPNPVKDQPWAFFLPLGLPLVNQKAVTFLNYPPDDSLSEGDYLDNFTMKRWAAVLKAVGVNDPLLYEPIVDARPIAAAGSGQANYMPDIKTYFNKEGTDHYYDTKMLTLLTNPVGHSGEKSLPVIVLGTPSREAWGQIIGWDKLDPPKTVKVLDVGSDTLPGASAPTAWVASNHPDVTTYQCCPGDPNKKCDGSHDLVADEKIDLQAACIIQKLAEDPSIEPHAAKQQCYEAWDESPSAENLRTICVRAKLDYDFTTEGQCKTTQEAEDFCSYYNNNACPTNIYTCDLPK